uniref:Transposase (Putative), gypsy type n=1 Tax=Tanacetum cinerariifolium TaxID=118510 RepID=A0A6L2KDA8_TANCI|nr:hypothetical protein [Tanacetum cinerariifolium]
MKTGSRPRAPHEVPLLTLTANRVIEMDDSAAATDSPGVPSTIERSPLDFSHEAGASDQGTAASEMPPSEDVPATDAPGAGQVEEAATDPPAAIESRKRGRDGTDVNAPPKVLRRDHTDPRPTGSAHGGKSLAAIQLGLASTRLVTVPENAPARVSDPDPLSFADPPSSQGTAAAGDPDSENASSPFAVGSPETRELEIKNMEALLEAETNVKKAAEDRSAGLSQELEDMCARYSDLQVSNERLSQQVATLQEQVSGEKKLKAAFKEFKRHRRAPMSNRTRAAPCRDEIRGQICCDPSGIEDLKYPLVDQLEGLKDAPMDVLMVALYLESDTGNDAPQYIRDLRPSSSQLTIPVYPEVRDPRNPWAFKKEMLLADTIATNISRAEKKKKCRIVCRTHGVSSAHHARSDGVPVYVPTIVHQGLALLLADAATQTELE